MNANMSEGEVKQVMIQSEVAEFLHVHANTLNYRLKRISEIGCIDFKDMDQKMSLYLDLKLERLVTKPDLSK